MFPGSCCDLADLWGGKGGRQDVLGWHLNAPQRVAVTWGKRWTPVTAGKSLLFYKRFITNAAFSVNISTAIVFLCVFVMLFLHFDFTHVLSLQLHAHYSCDCTYLHLETTTGIYHWLLRSSVGTVVSSIARSRPREVQMLGGRGCRLCIFSAPSFSQPAPEVKTRGL